MNPHRILLLVAVAVLAAGAASAQYPENCRNGIGIFTADHVALNYTFGDYTYSGAPGTFHAYGIVLNPYDDAAGNMARVGGYELRVVVPVSVYLLGTTLPYGGVNAGTEPDFLVTLDGPVLDDQCLLFDLTLGAFTGIPDFMYLAPPATGGTLPGDMALFNGETPGPASAAYPVSGDYAAPVFGFWQNQPIQKSSWQSNCNWIVPDEGTSFGALKALYR